MSPAKFSDAFGNHRHNLFGKRSRQAYRNCVQQFTPCGCGGAHRSPSVQCWMGLCLVCCRPFQDWRSAGDGAGKVLIEIQPSAPLGPDRSWTSSVAQEVQCEQKVGTAVGEPGQQALLPRYITPVGAYTTDHRRQSWTSTLSDTHGSSWGSWHRRNTGAGRPTSRCSPTMCAGRGTCLRRRNSRRYSAHCKNQTASIGIRIPVGQRQVTETHGKRRWSGKSCREVLEESGPLRDG